MRPWGSFLNPLLFSLDFVVFFKKIKYFSIGISITQSAGGAATIAIANSGVTPATYGDATHIPVIAVDSTGRVTSATNVPTSGGTTITSSTLNVTGGPAYDVELTSGVVTAGTVGSASQAAQITVDTYGRVTAKSQNPMPTLSSTTLTIAGGPAYTANLTSGIVTAGSYGSATQVPQITLDTYGRVTAVTLVTITSPAKAYADLNTNRFYPTSSLISATNPTFVAVPMTMNYSNLFTATSTTRWTYNGTGGTFLINAQIEPNSSSSGTFMEMSIEVNGVQICGNQHIAGAARGVLCASRIVPLNTNDYVELWFSNTSGTTNLDQAAMTINQVN